MVETVPLSRMVQEYIAHWNRDRPPSAGGRFAPAGQRSEALVSATAFLEERTRAHGSRGVPRKTIEKVRSALDDDGRLKAGYSPYTELRVADALVAAIGRPDAFHGTLEVLPNPRSRNRGSCCGGSMTGAL